MTKDTDSPEELANRPTAIAGRPTFSGAARLVYFCDAGCRPNPGPHLPVIWDGQVFLDAPRVEGTNHRASYHSVKVALDDAARHGATHVEVQLTSRLVFLQLSTGGYCRDIDLKNLRDLIFTLADRVSPIRIVLVTEPFLLGSRVFPSRRELRDHVEAIPI